MNFGEQSYDFTVCPSIVSEMNSVWILFSLSISLLQILKYFVYKYSHQSDYSSKYIAVNVSQLFQSSKLTPSGRYFASFSFVLIHYKVCYILHPPPEHQQQCVLLQLYHTIIPIVERGPPFSAAPDFTVGPQSFNSQTGGFYF